MDKWTEGPIVGQKNERLKSPIFEFDVNGKSVLAKGSMFSGKEEIYVDGQLVSKKRTYARKSIHDIEVDGETYQVKFYVKNPLTSKASCYLIKDNIPIKGLLYKSRLNYSLFIFAFIFTSLFFGTLGYLKSKYQLQDSIDIYISILTIAIPLILMVFILKNGYGEIVKE